MGKLYRRKRGGNFWGEYTPPQGERIRISLRTTDERVARDRLRYAEIHATNPAAHRPPESLSAALDLMSASSDNKVTERFYEQKSRHLTRVLGDVDIASLIRGDVAAYTHTRKSEGASSATVYKELVALRKALKMAHDRMPLPYSVADVMPAFDAGYKPRKRWLDDEMFQRLMAVIPERRRLWIMTACYTGANLSELEGLAWSDVDWSSGMIHIRGTKRDSRDRFVPIADPLRPWLEKAKKGRGPIVPPWGSVRRDLARLVKKINDAETALAKKEKRDPLPEIPKVTPNDLRRTFASWLKNRGVDNHVISRLMGHSSTRMVDLVYGQLSHDTFKSAMATLASPPGSAAAPCTTGVPENGQTVAPGGEDDTRTLVPNAQPETTKAPRTLRKTRGSKQSVRVPSPGIEPGTRGFSVRCSTS
jgi:integrase